MQTTTATTEEQIELGASMALSADVQRLIKYAAKTLSDVLIEPRLANAEWWQEKESQTREVLAVLVADVLTAERDACAKVNAEQE